MQINKNVQEITDFDQLFSQGNSKYNNSIQLTPEDQRAGLKIFCKEPYAQELYDLYFASGKTAIPSSKDFEIGQICKVTAKKVDFDNKIIEAQDTGSLSAVYIPFREFTEEPSLLVHNEISSTFKAVIYKVEGGDFLASEIGRAHV